MEHNIIVLGDQARGFLGTVPACLKHYGIQILSQRISGPIHTFRIGNFESPELTFRCSCFPLSPSKITDDLCKLREQLGNASQVVCTIPLKMLPEFRYNVDEKWEGIDNWLSPCAFQNAVRRFLPQKGMPIVWVLTGVSAVSDTNFFFRRNGRDLKLDPENVEAFETPQIVTDFLDACGEHAWAQNPNENEITCFGFLKAEPMAGEVIGEKVKYQWMKLALQPLFQKIGNG